MPKINQEEYEHINWLLNRVKKEIKRKDENLALLDWDSKQAERLSGQIEAFEYIEMLINEIGKPSYFGNKHRLEESEETEELRRSYFGPRFPKVNGFYNANLGIWKDPKKARRRNNEGYVGISHSKQL